jgi:hypothetical protein
MVHEREDRLGTCGEAARGSAAWQAEELLGWLEGHGYTDVEVIAAGGGVRVRCVCPPGLALGGGGTVLLWVV